MQQNSWKMIAIVCSTQSVWFQARAGLSKQLKAAGMSVLRPAALEPGKIRDAPVLEIRRSGICIVLLLLYDADRDRVASLAREEGMITAGWAWMLTEEIPTGKVMVGWLWAAAISLFYRDTRIPRAGQHLLLNRLQHHCRPRLG